jgi:hypothetical protein
LEENRVYRTLLHRNSPRWHFHDAKRKVLAEKGKPVGKLLSEVINGVWSNYSSVVFRHGFLPLF